MRDRREAADVGRHARLELVFACRGGRTVLADGYAEPPFRVGRAFPEGDGLHMIMASSAPGIFGGDRFQQSIRIEAGARVRLTSQSALQAHGSRADHAEFLTTCHVADGASLHCHWDPLIPFAGARLCQRIEIHLRETARLYWGDAFMSGRAFADSGSLGLDTSPSRIGERWECASLAHELRVMRGGTLEFLERHRIVPQDGRVAHPWVGQDACYFGTTVVSGSVIDTAEVERLQARLAATAGLRGAVDAVDRALVVARLMSPTGPPFHAARARLCRALSDGTTGRPALPAT